MNVYLVKIALRGVSPMVWRRLQIPENTSLANLHHTIQIVNGWDDEYLHQFHIYGKDYGISYEGGLMFSDNAHRVYFGDFEFDIGDKFTYEYNFFEHWLVDIRIETINESSASQVPIYCIKGNGMPGVEKYDEVESTLDLLKAVANMDDTTTASDLYPFIETLNAVKFNPHYINRRLQKGVAN